MDKRKTKKTQFYVKNAAGTYDFINHFGGNYDLYGATHLEDIFTSESIRGKIKKSVGAPKGKLRDFFNTNTSENVAAIIYVEYMYRMIQDVVAGDIAVLKRHGNFPAIYVGELSEIASDNLLKIAPPESITIDIRKLKYRFPRVVLNYGPNSKIIDRIVHIPKKLYNKMYENIRQGKIYPKIVSNVKKYK